MQGISAQAGAGMQNAYKFNAGTLLEERFDVNLYETPFRRYDAQIARFIGIDMLAASYAGLSPYQFGANNPISNNDPTGAVLSSDNFNGSNDWQVTQSSTFFSMLIMVQKDSKHVLEKHSVGFQKAGCG